MSSPPMSHRDGRDVPFKDFLFANSRPEDIRDSLIETCQLLDEWTRDAVGASAPSLMNFAGKLSSRHCVSVSSNDDM